MADPLRIIGIPGSLRKDSFNRALLRAIAARAPEGVEVRIEGLNGIPVYDGDDENASGLPDRVVELQDLLACADGLILATPEYNAGIPGGAKNAFDWLSRGDGNIHRVFHNLPTAIVGATPGRGGTRVSQANWLPTMTRLGVRLWFDKLVFVDGARRAFENGELLDEPSGKVVDEFIGEFVSFVREQPDRGNRQD